MERSSLSQSTAAIRNGRIRKQSGRQLPTPSRKSGQPRPGRCRPALHRPPGALIETIDNSQGTENAEFLAFLPELNAGLESYIGAGYDTISVRLLFGCFGGTTNGNGAGYLSDGGETTNCDSGGFGDVFILAGEAMRETPEPSVLTLAALGLLSAAWLRRRD